MGYFYNLSVMINLCCSQIVTMTSSETSVTAWVLAGLLCAVGLWFCAPLPLCRSGAANTPNIFIQTLNIFSDGMQDVTHRCPACNRVVARCKSSL